MATTINVGSICHCGFVRTPSNPHTECQAVTERIADVRMGDRQGEYLDATRHPNGLLTLRHFVPGTRPADSVVLERDEAAQLAAFILRTLHQGARYHITEAGRALLAGRGE